MKQTTIMTLAELRAMGKSLRVKCPRNSHAGSAQQPGKPVVGLSRNALWDQGPIPLAGLGE